MHSIHKVASPTRSRLIGYEDLRRVFGLTWSRGHTHRLEREGTFPKRVDLGRNTKLWVEAEVAEFVNSRIAERKTA